MPSAEPPSSSTDRSYLAGAVLFSSGASLGAGIAPAPGALVVPLLAAALLLRCAGRTGTPARRVAGAVVLALAGGICAGSLQRYADPLPAIVAAWERQGLTGGEGLVEVQGRLIDAGLLPDGRTELLVRIDRARPVGGCPRRVPRFPGVRCRLTLPSGPAPALRPGDVLHLSARLHRSRSYRNPGGFDYALYMRARGIALVGTVKSARLVRIVSRARRPAVLSSAGARRVILDRLREAVGAGSGRTRAFLEALLLGERQAMDRDLERVLQRAGVFHIVALSGLNVGIVALLAAVAARAFGGGPRACRMAAAAGVLLYWAVARGSGSIARASLMGILVLGGALLGRRVRPIGTASLSALLIVAGNAAWLADAGFQLSYAATLGILLLAPGRGGGRAAPVRLAVRELVPGAITGALWISAAAWIGTGLLAARHFHALTPAAVPANLVAVPVAGALLVLAIGLALAGAEAGGLARAGSALAEALLNLLEGVATACSAPPFLWFRVLPPSAACVLTGMAVLALATRGPRWRRAAWVVVTILLAGTAAAGRGDSPTGAPFEMVALDVGQGDAVLVRLPEGASVLVDAGPVSWTGFDAGERIVAPAVRALGLLRIDLLVVTHAHRDHLGGARAVLEELGPRAVWLGGMPPEDAGVRVLEDAAAARGIPVVRPRGGVAMPLGGARLEVLNPRPWARPGRAASRRNDESLVLRIVHAGRAVLLTGDIEGPVEAALLESGVPLRADLLKVAHHGSRTSTTAPFVQAVAPSLAVISVGARNGWGHPDSEVVGRLEAAGVEILRTDRDGAVAFTTRDGTPWVAVEPGGRRLPSGLRRPWEAER